MLGFFRNNDGGHLFDDDDGSDDYDYDVVDDEAHILDGRFLWEGIWL